MCKSDITIVGTTTCRVSGKWILDLECGRRWKAEEVCTPCTVGPHTHAQDFAQRDRPAQAWQYR